MDSTKSEAMEENVYYPPKKILKLDRTDGNNDKILRNFLIRSRVSLADWNRLQKKEKFQRSENNMQSISLDSKPIYDANDWPGDYEQIVQMARVDAGRQVKRFSVNSNKPNNTRNATNNNSSRLANTPRKRNYSFDSTKPYIQRKKYTAASTSSLSCMNRTSVTNVRLHQQDKRSVQPTSQEFVDRKSTNLLSRALQEKTRKLSSEPNTHPSLFESSFSHNNGKSSSCVKSAEKIIPANPLTLNVMRTSSGREIPLCDCNRGVSGIDLEQRNENQYLSEKTVNCECEKTPSCAPECLEGKELESQKTIKLSEATQCFGNETSRFNSVCSNASCSASEIITGERDAGTGWSSKDVGELQYGNDTLLDDNRFYDGVPQASERGNRGYSETCPANLNESQCCSGCYVPDKPPWDDGCKPTQALIREKCFAAVRAYRAKEYSNIVRERNKVPPIRPESPDLVDSPPRSCEGTTRHKMSCRAYSEFLSMLARQVFDFNFKTSVNSIRQPGSKSIPESEIKSEVLKESIKENEVQSGSLKKSITPRTTPTTKIHAINKNVVTKNSTQKIKVICCSDDETCCDSITSMDRTKKSSVERNTKNKASKISNTFRRKDISSRNIGKKQYTQNRKRSNGKRYLYPTYHLTGIVPIRYTIKNRKGELDSGSEEFASDSWYESDSYSSSEDLEPKHNPNKQMLSKKPSLIYENPSRDFNDPQLQLATNMYYISNDKCPSTDSSRSTGHLQRHHPKKYFSYEKQVNTEFKGSSESLLFNIGDNKNLIPIKISVSSETPFRTKQRRRRTNQEHANIDCKEIGNCLRNITRSRQAFFRNKKDIDSTNFLIDRKLFPRMNRNEQLFEEPSKLRTLSQSMKIEIQQNNTDSETLRQNFSDNSSLKEPLYSLFTTDTCNKSCVNEKQNFLTYYTDDVQTSTSDLPPFTVASLGNTWKASKKRYIDVATSNSDLLDSRRGLDSLSLKHNFQESKKLVPMVNNKSCTANISSQSMTSSVHPSQQNMFKHYSFYSSNNLTNSPVYGYRANEGNLKSEDTLFKPPATSRGATKLILAMNTSMDIACVQTDPSRSDEESVQTQRDSGTQTPDIKSMMIERPKISQFMTRKRNYEKPKKIRYTNYPHGKYIEKTESSSKTIPIKLYDELIAMSNASRKQKHILEHKPSCRERNVDILDSTNKLIFKKINPNHHSSDKIGINSNKKFEDMVSLKTFINKQTRPHISGVSETQSSEVKNAGALGPSNSNKNTKNKEYYNETSVIKQNLHHYPLKSFRTNPQFSTMYSNNKGKRLINLLPRIKISQNTKFEQPLCTVLPENFRKGKKRVSRRSSENSCTSSHASVSGMKIDLAHLKEQSDSKIVLGKEPEIGEKNSNRMTPSSSSFVNHESIHSINKSIGSRTFQKRDLRRLVFQKSKPRKSFEMMLKNRQNGIK